MFCSISSDAKETLNVTTKSIVKEKREQAWRPRVRFLETREVETLTPRLSLSKEEHQDTWYPDHELAGFKSEIHASCQKIRDDQRATGDTDAVATVSSSPEIITRGLERLICMKREQNKILAIWGTLKAQQRNNDPEVIATIARRWSFIAKEMAIMEAARDYCEVYKPDEVESLSSRIKSFESIPFPIKLKRKNPTILSSSTAFETEDACGRNVRFRPK